MEVRQAVRGFPTAGEHLEDRAQLAERSLQYSTELSARYTTHWLRRFRDGEIDTVEVAEEVTTRFNDVAAALGPTVWNTGCTSWYLTDERMSISGLRPQDDDQLGLDPHDRDDHVVAAGQKGGGS